MNKYDEIINMADEIVYSPIVKISDIPKVDLYMEQVLSLLEQDIGEKLHNKNEPVFTKTMVNNYTKEGILPRPEKKKYNKSHIIILTYVYILKQMLSIQDIKNFFNLLDDDDNLEELYSVFYESITEHREDYCKLVEKRINNINEKFKEKNIDKESLKLMTFISLISMDSMINKIICSNLLEDEDESEEN